MHVDICMDACNQTTCFLTAIHLIAAGQTGTLMPYNHDMMHGQPCFLSCCCEAGT